MAVPLVAAAGSAATSIVSGLFAPNKDPERIANAQKALARVRGGDFSVVPEINRLRFESATSTGKQAYEAVWQTLIQENLIDRYGNPRTGSVGATPSGSAVGGTPPMGTSESRGLSGANLLPLALVAGAIFLLRR